MIMREYWEKFFEFTFKKLKYSKGEFRKETSMDLKAAGNSD